MAAVPLFQFNEYDKKYRCCCKTIHVHDGAIIFTTLGFLLGMFALIAFNYNGSMHANKTVLIFYLVETVLALIGMKAKSHRLILPLIIWECVCVIVCSIWLIGIAFDSYYEERSWYRNPTRYESSRSYMETDILSFILVIAIAILIWKLHILLRCYSYYTDRSKALQMDQMMTSPAFSNPMYEKEKLMAVV